MAKNIFVDFVSIKGASEDQAYLGWVSINSFSLNASKQLTEPGNSKRTSGTAALSNITCTKDMDLATASLYEYCLLGKPLPKVLLVYGDVNSSTGLFVPVVTFEIKDVYIKTVSTSASGTVPSETFTLDFSTIKCDYVQQKAEGVKAGNAMFTYNRKNGTAKL